jgi:hypothetical protein
VSPRSLRPSQGVTTVELQLTEKIRRFSFSTVVMASGDVIVRVPDVADDAKAQELRRQCRIEARHDVRTVDEVHAGLPKEPSEPSGGQEKGNGPPEALLGGHIRDDLEAMRRKELANG